MKHRTRLSVAAAALVVSASSIGLTMGTAQPAQAWALTGCNLGDRLMTWSVGGEYGSDYELLSRYAAENWATTTWISSEQYIQKGPPKVWMTVEDYGNTSWAGRAPDAFPPLCGASEDGSAPPIQRILINHYEHRTATSTEKRSTIAHEFGHALGLAHPPEQVEEMSCAQVALMNHYWAPRSDCGVFTAQPDDIAGVNYIYYPLPNDPWGAPILSSSQAPSSAATPYVLDFKHGYDSLRDVATEASDVVTVQATEESRVEYIGGGSNDLYGNPVPFTVSTVRVTAVANGTHDVGDLIEVRQYGDNTEYAVNGAPILEPAEEYLLYLTPWETLDSSNTGQYLIVGEQAAWRLVGDHGEAITGRSNLPLRVSVSEVGGTLKAEASDGR